METFDYIAEDGTKVPLLRRVQPGSGVVFLGGLGASHALFEKGQYLLEKCEEKNIAFTSINWQTPENGLVSEWRKHVKEAFNYVAQNDPQVVVASSFGAWVGALLAKDLAAEGKGHLISKLVLINPVFDGSRLAASAIGDQGRSYLAADPENIIPFQLPSMQKPFLLQQQHLADGENNLIMNMQNDSLAIVNTHIFHASDDPVAPLSVSEAFVRMSDPSLATLEKISGGHQTNSPEFLDKLWQIVYSPPAAPAVTKRRMLQNKI